MPCIQGMRQDKPCTSSSLKPRNASFLGGKSSHILTGNLLHNACLLVHACDEMASGKLTGTRKAETTPSPSWQTSRSAAQLRRAAVRSGAPLSGRGGREAGGGWQLRPRPAGGGPWTPGVRRRAKLQGARPPAPFSRVDRRLHSFPATRFRSTSQVGRGLAAGGISTRGRGISLGTQPTIGFHIFTNRGTVYSCRPSTNTALRCEANV